MLFLGLGLSWALRLLSRRFHSSDRQVSVDKTGHFNAQPIGMTKGERRCLTASRWVLGLTVGVTWVLGCSLTTRFVGVPLEGVEVDVCEMLVEDIGKVDAIVLLGGGMGVHQECGRAEMYGSADRVWLAARLWNRFHLPITLSGGGAKGEKAFLMDYGVPEEAFREFEAARNTEEEAKMIFAALGKSDEVRPRILLVTSAWHMPRSKWLFERAGFDVLPAPTDYEMTCAKEYGVEFGDFFPSVEALARNSYCVKEWVARACYALLRK